MLEGLYVIFVSIAVPIRGQWFGSSRSCSWQQSQSPGRQDHYCERLGIALHLLLALRWVPEWLDTNESMGRTSQHVCFGMHLTGRSTIFLLLLVMERSEEHMTRSIENI